MNRAGWHSPTAVLAGCGDLGTRVALRLAATGYHIVGMRRHPEHLPDPIRGHAIDLSRETPRLPEGTAVVIGILTADDRTADGYRATYLAGLAHLLDAVDALDAGSGSPPRIVWVSSTAVYGEDDGAWIDETVTAVPSSPTGRVLLEAERLLHRRHPNAVVLRLSGLYGGRQGRLIDSVRHGTATVPPHACYTNRIHRDDAAAAIAHLADAVREPENLYLGTDDEPVDRGVLLAFLADRLGVAPPPASEHGDRRGHGKRFRNDRLRATGFELAYPTYREGYQAVLAAAAT